jgi:hypothetical protein
LINARQVVEVLPVGQRHPFGRNGANGHYGLQQRGNFFGAEEGKSLLGWKNVRFFYPFAFVSSDPFFGS